MYNKNRANMLYVREFRKKRSSNGIQQDIQKIRYKNGSVTNTHDY